MSEMLFTMTYKVDLNKPLEKTMLRNVFVTSDKQAHRLVLELFKNGQAITYAGKVNATLITYSDMVMHTATGTVDDGKPVLVFPPEFYQKDGLFCLLIAIGDATTTTTVFAGEGGMMLGQTDSLYDPNKIVPSLSELLAQVDAATAAASAANAAAGQATTAATSANTAASRASSAADRAEAAADGYEANNIYSADRLGGYLPSRYLYHRNLLRNGYLRQPINQRKQSSYTGAVPGLDGWMGMSRAVVTAPASAAVSGTTLRNSAPTVGAAYIQQTVDMSDVDNWAGAAEDSNLYTVALKSGETVVVASGRLGDTIAVSLLDGNVLVSFFRSAATNTYVYRITLQQGYEGTFMVDWAALYRGRYTADGLPPFVHRGKAAESQLCRQYFRRIWSVAAYAPLGCGVARTTTSASILIPRQPMRIDTPTVTMSGTPHVQLATGSTIAISSYSVGKISDDFLELLVTVPSGLIAGAAVYLVADESGAVYIDESAEL